MTWNPWRRPRSADPTAQAKIADLERHLSLTKEKSGRRIDGLLEKLTDGKADRDRLVWQLDEAKRGLADRDARIVALTEQILLLEADNQDTLAQMTKLRDQLAEQRQASQVEYAQIVSDVHAREVAPEPVAKPLPPVRPRPGVAEYPRYRRPS